MARIESLVEIKTIQHISLADAQALKLVSDKSPVKTFFETYRNEKSDSQEFLKSFKLVVFAGNEMIGPSVQVAELAGAITESMIQRKDRYSKRDPFVFLDIFSGSSATVIPSAAKFKGGNKYLKVIRVDNEAPEIDYLKILFGGNINIKCPKYKKRDVFEMIRKGEADKIFLGSKRYDICLADPPHYLTLNLLIGKMDGAKCVCQLLKEKVKVFIVYYAHREQRKLCEQICGELAGYFENVFRVFVGGEEMAVCYDEDSLTDQVVAGIEHFRETYKNRYGTTVPVEARQFVLPSVKA